MPIITIVTQINAPIERCFLLSLSVDLHKASVVQTNETIVGGISSGIMKLNDTVTWQAKHLGFNLQLTSKIIAYNKPSFFISEMQKGVFKKLHHQHCFSGNNTLTLMQDIFEFNAPFGIIGKFAERLFLTRYMKRFLIIRNNYIKKIAEGDNWQQYI